MTTPEQAASSARFTDNQRIHAASELTASLCSSLHAGELAGLDSTCGDDTDSAGGFVQSDSLPEPVPMGDPVADVTASSPSSPTEQATT